MAVVLTFESTVAGFDFDEVAAPATGVVDFRSEAVDVPFFDGPVAASTTGFFANGPLSTTFAPALSAFSPLEVGLLLLRPATPLAFAARSFSDFFCHFFFMGSTGTLGLLTIAPAGTFGCVLALCNSSMYDPFFGAFAGSAGVTVTGLDVELSFPVSSVLAGLEISSSAFRFNPFVLSYAPFATAGGLVDGFDPAGLAAEYFEAAPENILAVDSTHCHSVLLTGPYHWW